jgi:phosphonate ABC transporter permease subunit PhnE
MGAVGQELALRLGPLAFLGVFLTNLGDILGLLIASFAAVAGGAVLATFTGRIGKEIHERLPGAGRIAANMIFGAVGGAALAVLIGAGINWLYQIDNPARTIYWPAAVGAIIGLLLALRAIRVDAIPIGLAVYYLARMILNGLRSLEALIMAIVFVVWVGIGPFAGVLALSLHTIASQAKLFSEQVESIMPGPLEAVQATGATRLQTIVYAVVPQIIPPYISFTMYRWDINVRMSTIIGFAGGGGIGFLLFQNINLLNYRAASVQMLAIAVVVSIMDYFSSYMREKVV